MPEIARLETADGRLRLMADADTGAMEIVIMRHGAAIAVVPMNRENAEAMGRLMLAHAKGLRPIKEILTPVLQRAGVTRDMLVEDAEIVPGASR